MKDKRKRFETFAMVLFILPRLKNTFVHAVHKIQSNRTMQALRMYTKKKLLKRMHAVGDTCKLLIPHSYVKISFIALF